VEGLCRGHREKTGGVERNPGGVIQGGRGQADRSVPGVPRVIDRDQGRLFLRPLQNALPDHRETDQFPEQKVLLSSKAN
jgi:hypothetical protein